MAQVKLHTQQWSMQRKAARSRGRRSIDSSEPGLPAEFVVEGATTEEFDVQPRQALRRGGAAIEPLDFSWTKTCTRVATENARASTTSRET